VTVSRFLRDQTAEHVYLVRVGGRDQKIRLLDPGLNLHLGDGAVAHNAHDVQRLRHRLEKRPVRIDQRNVVILAV